MESKDEWSEELEDNILEKQDISSFCQDIISKMTPELGCKFMLSNSILIIKQLLESQVSE